MHLMDTTTISSGRILSGTDRIEIKKRYTHMFSLRLPRDFNQRNEWKNIHKQYDCGYFFKVEKTSHQ